jgi:hypothetical protein
MCVIIKFLFHNDTLMRENAVQVGKMEAAALRRRSSASGTCS